jgi:hypothetical protein
VDLDALFVVLDDLVLHSRVLAVQLTVDQKTPSSTSLIAVGTGRM